MSHHRNPRALLTPVMRQVLERRYGKIAEALREQGSEAVTAADAVTALVQAGTPSKNSTSRAARSASAVVTVNTVSTT